MTNEPNSEIISIRDIIIHPEWNETNHEYINDIGIAILSKKVQFSLVIQPISLPKNGQKFTSAFGIVTGWGVTEYSDGYFALTPSKLFQPIVDKEQCINIIKSHDWIKSGSFMCIGFEDKSRGQCYGDSGSGFYQQELSSLVWVVTGINFNFNFTQKVQRPIFI